MKIQALVFLFMSAVSAVSPPVCNEQSNLCKSLSKQDKSQCWRKIAKKNMKLETCLAPAHTVTSTRTIRPTSIVVITLQPAAVTKKVTQLTTETGAPVTPSTITVTATDVDVETITEADTTHATNFVTVTETETETEVATEIKLITETKTRTDPWSPPECDDRRVIGNKRELRQKRAQIPAECSCLLTATKGQEPVQTATVTVTKPAVTLTIFKITLKRPTVTRTVTLTRYAPGTTVSAPETTETITEHSTQTDHTLVTATDDVTDIFTETETEMTTTVTTQTETESVVQTASACSNPDILRKPGSLSNPTVFFKKKFNNLSVTESELTKICCDTCFANPDCAYFRVAWPHCETFGTHSKLANSCYPSQCPLGKPLLTWSMTPSPWAFYAGNDFQA